MAKRDSKPETAFGEPKVAPGLGVNPIAERTRRSMEESGKYRIPVGGGPSPPIPRLDMQATEGATMADQANAQRMPPPGAAVQQASSIVQGSRTSQLPRLPLLPGDILPEAAKADPNFIQGGGSMYATSQPELARKYGVIRSNRHIPPQQLMGTKGGLSSETVAGLEAAQKFQKDREAAEGTDPAIEAAAAAGPAGHGARLGQTSDEKPLSPEEKKRLESARDKMDDFDFHTLREMMMKDILNNEDQRKLIESRLEAMDLSDYVMNGYVTQRVPINSKLTYTFQSVDGHTDLALKRLIVKEMKGFSADDRYILDKYAIMAMACSIAEINNTKLPSYQDANGNFDEERFWEKFNKVGKFGLHMLASIGVNGFWFDVRVRQLVVADTLGNG